MIKNQFQKCVKLLRSYNSDEFLSSDCQKILNDFGIIHQRICLYSPQQNGMIERRHRSILQIVRSLIFQANLSTKFWGEAILHATYLLNRLPSSVINWKTPNEMLFKKSMDYKELKCLGCLCYSTIIKPNKDKFSPRVAKSIF